MGFFIIVIGLAASVGAEGNAERRPAEKVGNAAEGRAGDTHEPPNAIRAWMSPAETGSVLKLRPDELVRLKPYLRRADPTWSDLVEAANGLRSDLDVSKSLWGDACVAMGREQAAIAITIVSIKKPEHFRTTPGGYFHGMVTKAKADTLNLDRTLWGLRRANEPVQPWHRSQHDAGRQ